VLPLSGANGSDPVRLLDTDILIDIQRNHAPAALWFASLTDLPSVPGFVVMELIQSAPTVEHQRVAMRLVAPLPIVWPAEAECARALADFSAYHLSNNLGLIDAIIAACAVGRSDPSARSMLSIIV
jgi:predicted nucleic acid-binding protein